MHAGGAEVTPSREDQPVVLRLELDGSDGAAVADPDRHAEPGVVAGRIEAVSGERERHAALAVDVDPALGGAARALPGVVGKPEPPGIPRVPESMRDRGAYDL